MKAPVPDTAGLRPSVLQGGGLAGPGAAAGGVWVVARMQSEALARLGAAVDLVGGWLGVPPPAPVGTRFFRMRRPAPPLAGSCQLRDPGPRAASTAPPWR